jgi:hypothetical protein
MSAEAAGPSPPFSALRLTAPAGALPLGGIFGAIAVAGTVAVGLLHLDHLPFPVCVFKHLTGLPCPTCGSTRAVGRLFALDLPGALAMNPLTTLALLLLLLPWAAADLILLSRGRGLVLEASRAAARSLRVAAVALVLLNWAFLLAMGR